MDMLKNNEIQKIDTITFAERYKLNRPSQPTPRPSPPLDPPGSTEANCYMTIYTSNNTIPDHLLPTIKSFMMDHQGLQDTDIKATVDDKLFQKEYLSSKLQHQDITNADKINFAQTLIRFEEDCDTSEMGYMIQQGLKLSYQCGIIYTIYMFFIILFYLIILEGEIQYASVHFQRCSKNIGVI
jgi:hypothetical protein